VTRILSEPAGSRVTVTTQVALSQVPRASTWLDAADAVDHTDVAGNERGAPREVAKGVSDYFLR
jgi:hypothetical protein